MLVDRFCSRFQSLDLCLFFSLPCPDIFVVWSKTPSAFFIFSLPYQPPQQHIFDYGPYDVPILPLFTTRALSFQTQLRYYLFWLLTNILQIIDIVFEDCQFWRSASIGFCWAGENCLKPRGVDGFCAWEQDYWGSLMSYVDASMLSRR